MINVPAVRICFAGARATLATALMFCWIQHPVEAGNGCQWSPLPQFQVAITTTPTNPTVRPCESVTFNVVVTTVKDGAPTPGDWDRCHKPGYPDEFLEDTSLNHELTTTDGGTISGDTWTAPDTWPPAPNPPYTKEYVIHVRVYNDPSNPAYSAERADSEVTQDVTCTVTPDGVTVTMVGPQCDHYQTDFGMTTGYTEFIHCVAQADPACLSDKIEWTAGEAEPSATRYHRFYKKVPDEENGGFKYVVASPPVGDDLYLRFYGQPANNASFPQYWAKAELPHGDSKQRSISLFFDVTGTKNNGNVRNWYYYWKQTSASMGTHTLGDANLEPNFFGSCTFPQGVVSIGTNAYYCWSGAPGQPYFCYTWSGVDLFAVVCRHEMQHPENYQSWLPNGCPDDTVLDTDNDGIPDARENEMEARFGDAGSTPVCGQVWHFYSNNPRSNNGQPDEEVLTQLLQLSDKPWTIGHCNWDSQLFRYVWTPGQADANDWSSNGNPHQYNHPCGLGQPPYCPAYCQYP